MFCPGTWRVEVLEAIGKGSHERFAVNNKKFSARVAVSKE
jgi:predicted thioesterase